jgi:hypothetical protein
MHVGYLMATGMESGDLPKTNELPVIGFVSEQSEVVSKYQYVPDHPSPEGGVNILDASGSKTPLLE